MSSPSPTPPPLPPSLPPETPPEAPFVPYATPASQPKPDTYQTIADTVGLVPSIRKSDNKLQLITFAVLFVFGFLTILIGSFLIPTEELTILIRLALSAAGGFVLGAAGVLLTGIYLGIRNLFRPGKKA